MSMTLRIHTLYSVILVVNRRQTDRVLITEYFGLELSLSKAYYFMLL